ncbi:MAG: hypothetical protein FIA97_03465 [Methylococcaceae bacterium]|nr:hypothetical protein [Methylococcaceae bacterium]
MPMILLKLIVTAAIIVAAAELAKRSLWLGALLVSLPLVSILSMTWLYLDSRDSERVGAYAREILYLVPLSLVFFLPFVAEPRTHWPYWVNLGCGLALLAAVVSVAGYWRGG